MEHGYWVYIVGSLSGTLYIGMTNNLYRRALEHKSGELRVLPVSTDAIAPFTTKGSTMF